MRRTCCILGALILAIAAPVLAEPGDELTFRIVTMEAGDLVWEKFGHNTIWMQDASTGEDVIYNWGMFDFEQKHFFVNFARGRMRYWMEGVDALPMLRAYASHNRSIWSQELNLSPAQKLKLKEFLRSTEQPENRTYDYNYYMDNCSTRVRDAIDGVIGGQIRARLRAKPTGGSTFRWHTRRLMRGDVGWYTLLNTVLGPKTDRPINAWEECFLPLRLRDHLGSLTIKNEEGREVPLISAERVIFQSTRPPEPVAPPHWVWQYFLAGLLFTGVLVGSFWLGRRRTWARVGFGVAVTVYALVLGLCGLVGLHFWLFSDHWSAWRNENLFGYTPLVLPLVVLTPLMLKQRSRSLARVAAAIGAIVAASTVLGISLNLLVPAMKQVNAEPMALVLAPNLALAWTLWRHGKTHEAIYLPSHSQRAS